MYYLCMTLRTTCPIQQWRRRTLFSQVGKLFQDCFEFHSERQSTVLIKKIKENKTKRKKDKKKRRQYFERCPSKIIFFNINYPIEKKSKSKKKKRDVYICITYVKGKSKTNWIRWW